MSNELSEFGNFKLERVKRAYASFPGVREYRTELFGADKVKVSLARLNTRFGEITLTFTGGGTTYVFTFEVSTDNPLAFYGFRCESVSFTRRNFMFGGNILSLDRFVTYLDQQRRLQHNENMDSRFFSERPHSKSHAPTLHPPGGLHAPLLGGKASRSR